MDKIFGFFQTFFEDNSDDVLVRPKFKLENEEQEKRILDLPEDVFFWKMLSFLNAKDL